MEFQNKQNKQSSLILLAAGKGERFSGRENKLLTPIKGTCALERCLRLALGLAFVREIIVVVSDETRSFLEENLGQMLATRSAIVPSVEICAGGNERFDSVGRGLSKVSSEVVLIHDASRPFATATLYERVYRAVRPGVGAIPLISVVDSIVQLDENNDQLVYKNRAQFRLVQTPQGFMTKDLRSAREKTAQKGLSYSDEGSLFIAAGFQVVAVDGERTNIKITYEQDLEMVLPLELLVERQK